MRSFMRSSLALVLAFATVSTGFSQVPAAQPAPPAQNRIPQQIIVNNQRVNGAYVLAANGGMQSYTCPSSQEYVTPDGASRGWACYDSTTGVWLLNSLPPAQVAEPAPQGIPAAPPAAPQSTVVYPNPPVVYTQPATVVYTQPAYPVVVAPVYSPSVILG